MKSVFGLALVGVILCQSTATCTAQDCPPCRPLCQSPPCPQDVPFYCVTNGGCSKTSWVGVAGCKECCDLRNCSRRPPSPWDVVPFSANCSLSTEGPYLAPNPAKTKYGGMDVGNFGCRERISTHSDCCGMTPRFNWILSTCHKNHNERESMACQHKYGNTSALNIYYLSAYQWNSTHWIKDEESSVKANVEKGEEYVDFDKLNMRVGGGKEDWDLKYAPTTANRGTQGIGPPGMLFVLSAAHFAWSAFYLLNQLTLNRGPGGEIVPENCWEFGSGELDLLESPFWADVFIPPDRLYTTVGSDAGRCFPAQRNVPQTFHKNCTDGYCCEMCSCPNGTLCFGEEKNIGFESMGCIPEANRSWIPKRAKIFKVDGDDLGCGKRFGGVSGGASSNAFFNQANINGTGEYIYAAVVDLLGVKVYRWPTHKPGSEGEQEEKPNQTWPGIGKFSSADILGARQPLNLNEFKHNAPCGDAEEPCIIFEPSCVGDCPLVSAAGNFGPDELAGGYSAEAARDGLNWWDLFQKTADDPYLDIDSLPKWIPPLSAPFNCDNACSPEQCDSHTRCSAKDPFLCTKGEGAGGCVEDSTIWPLSGRCSGCCDVTFCAPPVCPACNASICDASPAFCSASDPYMCTAGESTHGCSADAKFWLRQVSCDTCCNIRYCTPPVTNFPVALVAGLASGGVILLLLVFGGSWYRRRQAEKRRNFEERANLLPVLKQQLDDKDKKIESDQKRYEALNSKYVYERAKNEVMDEPTIPDQPIPGYDAVTELSAGDSSIQRGSGGSSSAVTEGSDATSVSSPPTQTGDGVAPSVSRRMHLH